ncbi:MAG: imidazoleglycerol-phosphate dehydratase HisB [Sphaerochaetaceae bacterium]|nr:imidazoleglycerol-phosphate dehydratase HisB [Sphaerochaetaceae bacterium]
MIKPLLCVDLEGTVVESFEPKADGLKWIPGVFYGLRRLRKEGPFEIVNITECLKKKTCSCEPECLKATENKVLETLKGERIVFTPVSHEELNKERYDLANSIVVSNKEEAKNFATSIGAQAIILSKDNTWEDIVSLLLEDDEKLKNRKATVCRKTKETDISLTVNLDGSGNGAIVTSIGFFDHMLEQIVRHSEIDVELTCKGDLEVDCHHSVEDTAIVLGKCILEALGNKKGISRYGNEALVMDEVLATCSMDFSGRPCLEMKGEFSYEYIGDFPTEMIEHFFRSFCASAQVSMYLTFTKGNSHHQAEALFKAFARALKESIHRYPWSDKLPSTKGVL